MYHGMAALMGGEAEVVGRIRHPQGNHAPLGDLGVRAPSTRCTGADPQPSSHLAPGMLLAPEQPLVQAARSSGGCVAQGGGCHPAQHIGEAGVPVCSSALNPSPPAPGPAPVGLTMLESHCGGM